MKVLLRQAATRRDPRAIRCRHTDVLAGRCGGCPLIGVSLSEQRALKAELCQRFGLSVDEVVGEDSGFAYRRSAKRVVGGTTGALALGSFARGTHDVAPMDECAVDDPLLVQAFARVGQLANARQVRPFEETGGGGELRYVWAKTNGAQVLVTLFVGDASRDWSNLAKAVVESPDIVGCAVVLQAEFGNAIRSGSMPELARAGEADLEFTLLGASQRVGSLGFVQPNPSVAERAYRALLADVRGRVAFDLYAGAGATTRVLRQRFETVRAAEAIPESARALGEQPRTAGAFLREMEAAGRRPDFVVANPPRAGMGEEVCDLLATTGAPRIHIMSCHPRSLVRDLTRLESLGFRRASLQAFDTLPQTAHVELVAWLTRSND